MRLAYLAYTFSLAMMYFSFVLLIPIIVALIYQETNAILPFSSERKIYIEKVWEEIEKYVGQLEEIYNLLRKIEGMESRLSHLEKYDKLTYGADKVKFLQERIKLSQQLNDNYSEMLAKQKYIE